MNDKRSIKEITSKFSNPGKDSWKSDYLIVGEKGLFIFFSVDICESTKLKAKNSEWFQANKLLYNEKFESMHFWKFNGDEVLYAEPFSTIEVLISVVKAAYEYLKNLENELRILFKKDNVHLKGTMWIAVTDRNEKKNLHFKVPELGNEFLGISVDEGFRLSKKITGSKVVLDPKIVYLLISAYYATKNDSDQGQWITNKSPFYEYARSINVTQAEKLKSIVEAVYFIGYTKLKGVWNDRMYPVYWYFCKRIDFNYDELLDNKWIKYGAIKPIISDGENSVSMLERIFESVGEKDDLLLLLDLIASGKFPATYSLENYARLYYAVACVNPDSGKILIARRSDERKHLRGVWEFIPYRHTTTAISDFLEKRFEDEFGVGIHIVTDQETENNPVPLHFCTIYRNGRAHNSLLCMAIFDKGYSDDDLLKIFHEKVRSDLYSDFQFVGIRDAKRFNPITMEDIKRDSINALSGRNNGEVFEGNRASMYFPKSVKAVRSLYKRVKDNDNGDAWIYR